MISLIIRRIIGRACHFVKICEVLAGVGAKANGIKA